MIPNALPKSLADNPMLDRWLHFRPDGRLRVAVGKWKPAALYLYHQPVTLPESMCNIREIEFYGLDTARRKWHGIFKTVAVPAPHDLAAYQHLVSVQFTTFCRLVAGAWKYVDDFYNKVGIRGIDADL